MHDTEDKKFWTQKYGETHERNFIEVVTSLGINGLKLNPDKKNNPTVIDYEWGRCLADLKTQTTPFFTADRYCLKPRYTVTFNRVDYERYTDYEKSTGKKIYIFYWLNWEETVWKEKATEYLFGIFFDNLSNIKKLIEDGAPEHHYERRGNDEIGNAKSSFLLDIRKFRTIIQIPNKLYVPECLMPKF